MSLGCVEVLAGVVLDCVVPLRARVVAEEVHVLETFLSPVLAYALPPS